eukprot:scaffold14900_cov103-Isochrysis_galbana.AAC.8
MRLKGGGKAKQAVHRMAGDAMYVGAKVRPPFRPSAICRGAFSGCGRPKLITSVPHLLLFPGLRCTHAFSGG